MRRIYRGRRVNGMHDKANMINRENMNNRVNGYNAEINGGCWRKKNIIGN